MIGKNEMQTLPKIVAIDFDGTLVEDQYPAIGAPNKTMFKIVKQLQHSGVKIILWTCRDDMYLATAVRYCEQEFGLVFDAVNENIAETQNMFQNDTRKVYADLYIDDKAVPHSQSPYFWLHYIGIDPYPFMHATLTASENTPLELNMVDYTNSVTPLSDGALLKNLDYAVHALQTRSFSDVVEMVASQNDIGIGYAHEALRKAVEAKQVKQYGE